MGIYREEKTVLKFEEIWWMRGKLNNLGKWGFPYNWGAKIIFF